MGLLQNVQLVQRPVIPRKTAAHRAAVFRGNPPLLPGKRIATPVCALARNDRLVQNSYFAAGPLLCKETPGTLLCSTPGVLSVWTDQNMEPKRLLVRPELEPARAGSRPLPTMSRVRMMVIATTAR